MKKIEDLMHDIEYTFTMLSTKSKYYFDRIVDNNSTKSSADAKYS